MYKLLINPMTNQLAQMILKVEDNTYIPMEPANTDYQAYLEWVDEGNTAEEAD